MKHFAEREERNRKSSWQSGMCLYLSRRSTAKDDKGVSGNELYNFSFALLLQIYLHFIFRSFLGHIEDSILLQYNANMTL